MLVEVTWTPKDQQAGKDDIKQRIEFDPEDEIAGEKRKWTVVCNKTGVPELKEETLDAPRQVKPRNKRGKDWGDEDAVVLVTSASLHDPELVGIDTCSAVSVDRERRLPLRRRLAGSKGLRRTERRGGSKHVNRRARSNGGACGGR